MAPHRQIKSQGFGQPYQKRLAKAKISASRFSLARSAITLRRSYPRDFHLGSLWSMVRGVGEVFSTLNHDLTPSVDFRREPLSYRDDDSFLLAEALTHWIAQTFLDVNVLLAVERNMSRIGVAYVGAPPVKPMPAGYRPPRKNAGKKSAPDFIGLGTAVHVLESKGRSNFGRYGVTDAIKVAARNKALHQVCRVATVDGKNPATRTSCVFSFEDGSLSAWIDDPAPTEQTNLRLDRPGLLRAYYDIVLDPIFENLATDRGDERGIDFAPGWRFAIDRKVLERVRDLQDEASAERLEQTLIGRRLEGGDELGEGEGRSVGPDGLMLIGPPDFEIRPDRKRRR